MQNIQHMLDFIFRSAASCTYYLNIPERMKEVACLEASLVQMPNENQEAKENETERKLEQKIRKDESKRNKVFEEKVLKSEAFPVV